MRLLAAFSVLVALGIGALVLSTTAFRPPPAADRLAGVALTVTGHATDDLDNGRHRLRLTVDIASLHDLDVCLGFTLDEPFAGRRMRPETADCVKPRTGHHTTSLVFDTLTDDDVRFPAHTLVWGIPGGRCGAIFEAFGVCVVDMAGTAAFELPTRSVLPSFGTFGPLLSFGPLPSFEP